MPAYGLSHIFWLIGIAGTATGLCVVSRRKLVGQRVFRTVLACVLAAVEIERTLHDGVHFPDRMPFNLCNVATWAAVLALVTLNPMALEFAYFEGIAAAAMALLMPDMGKVWPVRFFLNHGGTIVATTALVFGRMAGIRPGAVWRAFGMLAIYVAVLGAFDFAFGVNYGYLRHKPEGVTLMNLLGPWPIYVLWDGVVGLGLFSLLWIPARRSAA